VCMVLLPLSSYAAGLGKLNVNSGIGEPLKAEIELLSVTPEELSTLTASIASEDAYAQQGITHLGIHNNIKVEIAKSADGSPILKVRSSQPISDPYLDILIQVDWAAGRLQREYTVLLDPPGYKPESTTSTAVVLPSADSVDNIQSTSTTKAVTSTDVTQPNTKKAKEQKRLGSLVAQQYASTKAIQSLTTKRGDTLGAVAKEMQVEGVSLDQMLVGLYEGNKEAFAKGNMNRLKVGQIIKVPSKEVLTGLDNQQAKKTIKMHSVNWSAYRNALAANVEVASGVADPEQKQSMSGKIASAQDKSAPATTGPKDVVKLSAGDEVSTKSSKDVAIKSAEAKIIALQEEATARENSLKEANDKTIALEKQIADMQKLITMKNQSMTELQKNAEAITKKSEVADAPIAKVAPVETHIVKPVTKQPIVVVPVATPTKDESGFLAGLMSSIDSLVLLGAGGVALLGAGWMFLRNKRRKDLDSFERGILTSGGLRANTVFGNTTGNASMSDTSFLTDFAQSADGGMIDTNDVDPIAEAEVYMAYGRDAQAEEILKDAISKEPKRYELHLKLLEMYAARKDTSAFEAIAGELYTTLGADDPTWAKVAAIGVGMEPSNPLYNVSTTTAISALAEPKLSISDFLDVAATESPDLDLSFNNDVITSSRTNDDLASAVIQSSVEPKDVDSGISFDLGTPGEAIENSAPIAIAKEAISASNSPVNVDISEISSKDSTNLMDFDLGDLTRKPMPVIAGTVSETRVLETSENSLDFNVPDIASLKGNTDSTDNPEVSLADFDMDFNFPTEVNDLSQESLVVPNSIDDISFDLDFSTDTDDKLVQEKLQTDTSEVSAGLTNIEEGASTNKVETLAKSEGFEANTFDLTNIDLSLADAESELSIDQPISKKAADSVEEVLESPDVNIKLDLVAAYIDMDDKEGARELLEEVLKEGGPIQQLRAQELLDSLV